MWKKTMTATVACLMTFSLAACGSSDEGKTAGVSGDIKVYTRDSSSGTREAFEKGVDFEGSLTKNAIEVSSNDDMAAKVGADKNGIGYTSLSTDFEKNGVSALQYEGVTASSESVLDGSYKLQRPFMYVTRAAGDYGSDDKEQLVQAFLDFMQNSTEGMAIVKKNGGEVDESKAKPWDELSKKYEAVLGKDNSAITITTGEGFSGGVLSNGRKLQIHYESVRKRRCSTKSAWKRKRRSEQGGYRLCFPCFQGGWLRGYFQSYGKRTVLHRCGSRSCK